jgi:hypothetical protein
MRQGLLSLACAGALVLSLGGCGKEEAVASGRWPMSPQTRPTFLRTSNQSPNNAPKSGLACLPNCRGFTSCNCSRSVPP